MTARATEKVDFAARGFFEVSRRNLFGSNRIATVFTRGSLRPRDRRTPATPASASTNIAWSRRCAIRPSFGIIDAQVSGYFEQAVRTSFNFRRRGLQAEFARRVRRDFTLVGRYALSHTELFDERITDEERPDIDRLFPQVRLSVFSAAARRDRRDDILDPTRGTVIGLDTDVAVRALGSEVGFVKGFGELYWYRQLPGSRAVLATGARLGLAKGFPRVVPREIDGVPVIGPDGNALVDRITDLPASERFFAGGDTTVRGYARDTLGDQATISRGFPRGGNALIIFNSELRVPVWRDIGGAVFIDVGNVFSRVSEIELSHLRPTAGFGLRYKSPIGPIRVDLGFKLDRGRFDRLPGDREPLWEFHISIGQAFYRMMRLRSQLVMALALIVASMHVAAAAHAQVLDRIVATVGQQVITLSDARAAVGLGLLPDASSLPLGDGGRAAGRSRADARGDRSLRRGGARARTAGVAHRGDPEAVRESEGVRRRARSARAVGRALPGVGRGRLADRAIHPAAVRRGVAADG